MTKENRLHGRERVVAMLIGRPVDWLPRMPITMMFAAECLGIPYRDYATDPPAPPASPLTLAGVLKTQGNGVENSTNCVSASAQI